MTSVVTGLEEDPMEMYARAREMEAGEGGVQDFPAARLLYKKGANSSSLNTRGKALCMYGLGRCYAAGRGVERSVEQAVRWFTEGAQMGNPECSGCLAQCYLMGIGVPRDERRCFHWLQVAAERAKDDPSSEILSGMLHLIGLVYQRGRGGAMEDAQMAEHFFERARNEGSGNPLGEIGSGTLTALSDP